MSTSETDRETKPVGVPCAAPGLDDGVELWLIRHGETEWSATGRHTGTTDVPLTAKGEEQARQLPRLLGGLRPARVVCSPLQRARRTAELAGLAVDDIDPDLVEWDYGEYEGRTTPEISREVPHWSIWTHGAPGGETFAQIQERADRVLERAVREMPRGPVVLVGHGHFSRAIAARWIGMQAVGGATLLLGTAALSVLGVQHGVCVIDRWNVANPAE